MDNYSSEELYELGIQFGEDVRIDRSVRFFGPQSVTVGSHVRIDCHAVISAESPITVGSYVHLSAGVQLFGRYGITIEDFCNLSPRVTVFTATDDFVSGHLIGPTVPDQFRNVMTAPVAIRRHSVVGCGSVILPGVELGRGCAIGALSVISKSLPQLTVAYGADKQSAKRRDGELLAKLESDFLQTEDVPDL